MKDVQERLEEIEKIKKKYAFDNKRIPIEVCQDILEQEQKALVELYLKKFGGRSYERRIAQNLGRPQISELLSSGLEHDANTVVLSNRDNVIEELKKNKMKTLNGIRNRNEVVDDPTYLEYMVNTDGVALDHYLTIFPHELRHLFGTAGDSDLEGFGFIAEGKTELDTRRVCKENGITYYMGRNYTQEATYIAELEGIVGADVIDDYVCFKSQRFSDMIDKYDEEEMKQFVFDYIQCRESNSIKKAVALAHPDLAKQNFDELKKVSKKLEEFHPLELTDELLETDTDLQSDFSKSPELKCVVSDIIRARREKMQSVKDCLGDNFQAVEQSYNQIEKDRSDFFSTKVVSRLNIHQIAELRNKIMEFNIKYHKDDMVEKEQEVILSKVGLKKYATQTEVMLENQNAAEAMTQIEKTLETRETDITVDEK